MGIEFEKLGIRLGRRHALIALALLGAMWVIGSGSDPDPAAAGDGTPPGSMAPASPGRGARAQGDRAQGALAPAPDPERSGAPGIESTAVVAPGAQPPVRESDPPPAASVRPARQEGPSALLGGAIEREVARAVARAREGSKGKVHGSNTVVSVHVRDLEGRTLVSRLARSPLRPASNLKLLTCATALVLLGPDASFETTFLTRDPVAEGVLEGDLIVSAGGDPLYRDGSDGSIEDWIGPVARHLRELGIQRVQGSLVLDEGEFLSPGPGPGWPDPKEYWKEYCALSAGFSANAGCLTATVLPAAPGGQATVRVRPRTFGLDRKGTVTTGKARSSLNVAVGANSGGVTVRGSIPSDVSEYEARFSAPDPVELFGHAVVGSLERNGVSIRSGFRRQRGAAADAKAIAVLASPMRDALVPVLRDSNNSVADQLFVATAHGVGLGGTREGGLAATRRALEALGVTHEGLAQVDGSGLSRDNRVSTEQLTALLAEVLEVGEPATELFLEALPVAGISGSLAGRMKAGAAKGRVRAKTGFIGGTSGLSGFVETRDGRTLIFSILVDYPRFSGLNNSAWKPMQDAICEVLVEYTGG